MWQRSGGDKGRWWHACLLWPGDGENRRIERVARPGELVYVQITGRYNEATLADLALLDFYIAHRLLDFTKIIFDIDSKEFFQHYKDWHKEIKD